VTEPLRNCSNRGKAKSGPKPSAHRAALRKLFREWSERTFATYYKAHCQLLELGYLRNYPGHSDAREVLQLAIRPSGSINVTKYARIAEMRCVFWIAENFQEEAGMVSRAFPVSPCRAEAER